METVETQIKPAEIIEAKISHEVAEKELYQKILDKKLAKLKQLNFDSAVVNVWVTDVKTRNKSKRFDKIKRLQLHENAQINFKSYVENCIFKHDHIAEFKNITTNQDNRFFHVESASTDLSQMVVIIENEDISTISEKSELNDYNSYAVQLTLPENAINLFAFRYIKSSWSVDKAKNKFFNFNLINNELVADIKEDSQFTVDPYIDFIQLNDDIFISNLRQFEVAMNFQERLKEKKVIAITALCESCALSEKSKDPLTRIIGSDKFLMRQLASVHEKGYFKNELWLTKLKKAAKEAGNWKIKFDDDGGGEIIVEENKDYIKELLILLQNKRVKTVVDGVIFDVDGELIEVDLVK